MSYTRSYQKSVTVTGSVSYSYPASEHGGHGTATYSKTVPVTININVDTRPFDDSVSGATNKVDLLTGAVVAMESAQIASIKENSKNIADRIIRGFFHTINADITTQRTESTTALHSRFALLAEYSKAIAEKKDRMEKDNATIREHYGVIFRDIDDDFSNRIEKLDRESFYLANIARNKTIQDPEKNSVPFLLLQMIESNRLDGLITTARVRSKVANVFDSIADYLFKSNEYMTKVSAILEQEKIDVPKQEFIPTVFYKEGNSDGSKIRCFAPDINNKNVVLNRIYEHASNMQEDEWRQMENNELSMIDQSFAKNVESYYSNNDNHSAQNQRVAQEIMRLWQNGKDNLKTNYS